MSCWLSCADKWLSHFQLQLPPSCFILPTSYLAQSTQRAQRCLVGCRAPINGCRCEMAYGYRAEDAESTEMSCWLSCADKWLSHFQLQLPPSCFILPTSYLAQSTQRAQRCLIGCRAPINGCHTSNFNFQLPTSTSAFMLPPSYFFSACRKSAIKSSASSIPAEIRINSAGMSWAEPAAWVKIRGNSIKLSTPPKLTA